MFGLVNRFGFNLLYEMWINNRCYAKDSHLYSSCTLGTLSSDEWMEFVWSERLRQFTLFLLLRLKKERVRHRICKPCFTACVTDANNCLLFFPAGLF